MIRVVPDMNWMSQTLESETNSIQIENEGIMSICEEVVIKASNYVMCEHINHSRVNNTSHHEQMLYIYMSMCVILSSKRLILLQTCTFHDY